jgi:hypothetical protein
LTSAGGTLEDDLTQRHFTALDENEVPFTINYTEIRHNVAIDDVKFDKPAAKP